jgi:hypothetical protein
VLSLDIETDPQARRCCRSHTTLRVARVLLVGRRERRRPPAELFASRRERCRRSCAPCARPTRTCYRLET